MRIAIFTDTFLPHINGVVRTIVTLANSLAKRGHDIKIFTIDTRKIPRLGSYDAWPVDNRIQIQTFSSMTAPGFPDIQIRYPLFFSPLRQLRAFRPDVMHSHTCFNMGWEGLWLSKWTKYPLVGTHHGFLADYMSNIKMGFQIGRNIMRSYVKQYYNRCDAVTTPCQALADDLFDLGMKNPVQVLSNPLEFSELAISESKQELRAMFDLQRPTVVYFGRLVAQKDLDTLLKAFARLSSLDIDADLWIIGEGREQAKLEQLSASLNLTSRVRFLGQITGKTLLQRVKACDVFASASTTEAQPLVFLEAMALGLPSIGVAAGGIPECIQHENNGLIATPNDPQALSEAMALLLNDPARCLAYGRAAQTSMQAFAADRVAGDLEQFYGTVISDR